MGLFQESFILRFTALVSWGEHLRIRSSAPHCSWTKVRSITRLPPNLTHILPRALSPSPVSRCCSSLCPCVVMRVPGWDQLFPELGGQRFKVLLTRQRDGNTDLRGFAHFPHIPSGQSLKAQKGLCPSSFMNLGPLQRRLPPASQPPSPILSSSQSLSQPRSELEDGEGA